MQELKVNILFECKWVKVCIDFCESERIQKSQKNILASEPQIPPWLKIL